MFDVTASIVLYQNDREVLLRCIDSFLSTDLNIELYLFDNSPSSQLSNIISDNRVIYFFNGSNVGFGTGHNHAIRHYMDKSTFHLVLNPDIYFSKDTIKDLYGLMFNDNSIGLVMPKILYPNGELQYLCKRNPTPYLLFIRRFVPEFFLKYFKSKLDYYEYRDRNYNELIYDVPYLSGCFMFFRIDALRQIGLFDERIFMYIEDADITRRILSNYRTLYYPKSNVYHYFEKGSHKKLKLMLFSIHGAIIYFNKWGWLQK